MDSIKEMDTCIKCLYLEVPKHVADDVSETWEEAKKEIERLRKEKEWLVLAYAELALGSDSNKNDILWVERRMQQALKEAE